MMKPWAATMSTSLQDALQSALAATQDCDPRDMSPAELASLDQLDGRIFEIMDALITDFDECGPETRACLEKARLRK